MENISTPYASSSSIKYMSIEMFPFTSRNDFKNELFEEKQIHEDFHSPMNANDDFYFGHYNEEEAPKFKFSRMNSLQLGNEGELSIYGKPNVGEKEAVQSIHSQISTKACFTKEDKFYEDLFNDSNREMTAENSNNFFSFEPCEKQINAKKEFSIVDIMINNQHDNEESTEKNIDTSRSNKTLKVEEEQKDTIQNYPDINKEIDLITSKITSKNQNKCESNFAKRKDVVNKTILRSMRRYYSVEFELATNFSALSDKEKFSNFHELIKCFVEKHFKMLNDLSGQDIEDTIFFFGSMVSHVHMRRGITVSKQRTEVNLVHKCLLNYSQKKLAQLISGGGFKHVLRHFLKFGGLDVVINGEDTMTKNQDLYKHAAEELFLLIQS